MQNHDFPLQPSKIYFVFLSILVTLSAVIVLTLPINVGLKIGGVIGVLVYGLYLLRERQSIVLLRHHRDEVWHLTTRKEVIMATLRGDSTVTRWVSILRFNVPNQLLPVSCVVVHDSLGMERYRQLVVLLKMG